MNVSACLVTRGDVPMDEILDSLTASGIDDIVVYDNSQREDLAVYGRYAAIAEAKHDLILTQDDDCVVSDPQAIVDEWKRIDEFRHVQGKKLSWETYADYVVCNMPQEFRHEFYEEHALVGFGACFHRDAPCRAFGHLFLNEDCINPSLGEGFMEATMTQRGQTWHVDGDHFHRTCDIVFTALTPRVLVDVPVKNLWWAENHTRMYRQAQHVEERTRMLELVKRVRDA